MRRLTMKFSPSMRCSTCGHRVVGGSKGARVIVSVVLSGWCHGVFHPLPQPSNPPTHPPPQAPAGCGRTAAPAAPPAPARAPRARRGSAPAPPAWRQWGRQRPLLLSGRRCSHPESCTKAGGGGGDELRQGVDGWMHACVRPPTLPPPHELVRAQQGGGGQEGRAGDEGCAHRGGALVDVIGPRGKAGQHCGAGVQRLVVLLSACVGVAHADSALNRPRGACAANQVAAGRPAPPLHPLINTWKGSDE